MKNVFDSIPVPKLGRSFFDLSHTHKFDCDAGQIIPFLSFPFIPGDHFKIGNNIVVRPQPMVVPILSEVNIYTYYFAVSNRIMFGSMVEDDDGITRWEVKDRAFERFISGGEARNGEFDDSIKEPLWRPTGSSVVNDNWNGISAGESGSNLNDVNVTTTDNGIYSLWDYFGLPVGVAPQDDESTPKAYLKRAYNLIYNWYFRDKNFEDEVDVASNNKVLNCCWKKDYFTSALPWTQRGPEATLPIDISITGLDASLSLSHHFTTTNEGSASGSTRLHLRADTGDYTNQFFLGSPDDSGARYGVVRGDSHEVSYSDIASGLSASSSSVTINDLRYATRLQQWMERNAITGIDYRQFILAHFGVAPADERLQKPLFLGSSINPLWVSEVVQTSESSNTPQGNLSGHGLTAGSNFICRYSAKEFGWIIAVMVIKPKASYQQGIPRYLLYQNRFEYPFPEFMRLGERAITRSEIFATDSDNLDDEGKPRIFGYTGMYNELRYMNNTVSGGLRDTFNYWHWGRIFASAPELNTSFLKMRPDKRIFLVKDEPSFIINVGNVVQAWRPMPKYPVPEVL